MHLQIISPLRTLAYEIVWIDLQTDAGNFVIQSGHAPMILVLAPHKEIQFRLKNGKDETLIIPQGVAEITREHITLIINE
jgi:F0F1-type ATP synthase epsilon subunit